MGQNLSNGVYLPDEGERNCYSGLAANWNILNTAVGNIAGKASSSHTHGNISNDGKVGTTANVPLITGTGGAVQAGSFGTSANTFCEGNDSRLSDARTPVAHTHTKSDVTDLFNSDFIPSSDNSYNFGSSNLRWKQIWCSGYKTKSDNIDFTDSTTTGTKESWWVEALEKNGTGFFSVGSYRNSQYGTNAEHFRIKNAGGKWADLYIQLDDNNQFTIGTSTHSDVITNGFRGKFTPLDSFIPYVNNSYDLGSSSYQWNNLYAKNYFYKGTAWGLDKSNWWSLAQFYSRNSIHVRNVEPGVAPSSDVTAGIKFENANASYAFADIVGRVSSSGITFVNLIASNKFTNGALDPNGTNVSKNFQIGIRSNGTGFVYTDCGWRCNLVPPLAESGVYSLGTSTNKWKTLNGINPGALSLPDFSAEFDVSGQIVPPTGESQISINWGKNTFTPSVNGWLSVRIHKATYIKIYRESRASYCFAARVDSADDICVCSPVVAGVEYTIKIQATQFSSGYDHFRLSPCAGNV